MNQPILRLAENRLQPSITLCQNRLDISEKSRRSRLPWRGQFSPELVEYLLELLSKNVDTVYDPFCGSGTVLFEALNYGLGARGLEINPAAWHLAALSRYTSLTADQKFAAKSSVKRFAADSISGTHPADGFDINRVLESLAPPFCRLAVSAVYLLALANGVNFTQSSLQRAARSVIDLFAEMDLTGATGDCYLGDARNSPLPSASVELAITSPPYINVFNYHQNYRPAVERLGWTPLEAARAEIGSNRKNRGNRFLTVTQYCLDMRGTIADLARVLKPGATLVMVLGRTSNVLGTSFQNGEIIRRLLVDLDCFDLVSHQTRSFMNRFGDNIKEDLFFVTRKNGRARETSSASDIALDVLRSARRSAPQKAWALLDEAIEKVDSVKPSPEASLTIPEHFS